MNLSPKTGEKGIYSINMCNTGIFVDGLSGESKSDSDYRIGLPDYLTVDASVTRNGESASWSIRFNENEPRVNAEVNYRDRYGWNPGVNLLPNDKVSRMYAEKVKGNIQQIGILSSVLKSEEGSKKGYMKVYMLEIRADRNLYPEVHHVFYMGNYKMTHGSFEYPRAIELVRTGTELSRLSAGQISHRRRP